MRRILILPAVFLFLASLNVYPQQLPPPEPVMPEEYNPDEFPLWAHDLRRFEVVTIGTYPLTFLVTSLVFDFSVYAANNFNPAYSMGSQRDNQDIAIISVSAAGVSILIGIIDLIINTSRREKQESKDEQ